MLDSDGALGMVVGETATGAIVVTAHQLQLSMDGELRELGLSARGFVTLCTIRDNPGLSRAALGREQGIAPQAVGAMAARLIDAGLAEASPATRAIPPTTGSPRAGWTAWNVPVSVWPALSSASPPCCGTPPWSGSCAT